VGTTNAIKRKTAMLHNSTDKNPSSFPLVKQKSTDYDIKEHFTDTLDLDLLQSRYSSLIINSINFSKLKTEAKKTKNKFNLKLTANQDRLAQKIGFNNWKQVKVAHDIYLPTETAYKEGVVVILRKDALSKLYQGEEHFTHDHELYKLMLSEIYQDKFGNNHWWDKQQPLLFAHKEQWFQSNYEEEHSFYRLKPELLEKYSLTQILLLVSIAYKGVPAYVRFKGEIYTSRQLQEYRI